MAMAMQDEMRLRHAVLPVRSCNMHNGALAERSSNNLPARCLPPYTLTLLPLESCMACKSMAMWLVTSEVTCMHIAGRQLHIVPWQDLVSLPASTVPVADSDSLCMQIQYTHLHALAQSTAIIIEWCCHTGFVEGVLTHQACQQSRSAHLSSCSSSASSWMAAFTAAASCS